LITFDGIYVDDNLTEEEMYNFLAENITLDQLKDIKINRAREEAKNSLGKKYTELFIKQLEKYSITYLQSLRTIEYANSPYALTYSGFYDENTSLSKEHVSHFEHMIARNTFYLTIKKILYNRKDEYTHKGKAYRQQIAKLNRGKSKSKNR